LNVTGYFGRDTVTIQGKSVENVEFGTANTYSVPPGLDNSQAGGDAVGGVAGVGPEGLEALAHEGYVYPTLPRVLFDADIISALGYGVYLGDFEDTAGEVIFGGIDTAKFSGNLTIMNCYNDALGTPRFLTPVTGISVSGSPITLESSDKFALLDTGTSNLQLPSEAIAALIEQAGIVQDNITGLDIAPCSVRESNISVTLSFGSVDIVVSAAQLFLPNGYAAAGVLTNQTIEVDGVAHCQTWFSSSTIDENRNYNVFGQPFFQSAYVFFDLAGRVAMAPKVDTNDSNIVEVTVDDDGKIALPGATSVVYSSGTPQSLPAFTGVPSTTESAINDLTYVTASLVYSTGSSTGSATGSASSTHKSSASHSYDGAFKTWFSQGSLAVVLASFGLFLL
jgi:hypothetical protein